MANLTTVPFRFLDLPKELRLMVYEQILVGRQHRKIRLSERVGTPARDQVIDAQITVITHSLTVQLLATCRLIYHEALPFIQAKIDWVVASPPRMIVGSRHMEIFAQSSDLLDTLVSEVRSMEQAISFGTHLTPPLTWSNLRHRLLAKMHGLASTVPLRELKALSSFINHAGHSISTNPMQTNIELAFKLHNEANSVEEHLIRSALDRIYDKIRRASRDSGIKIDLKLSLPRGMYANDVLGRYKRRLVNKAAWDVNWARSENV